MVRADYRKFKVKSKIPDFEREEPERFYRRKLEDISRINPALGRLKLLLIKEAGDQTLNLNVSKAPPMVFLTTGKETLGQFHPYVKDAIKGSVSGLPPELKLEKSSLTDGYAI